MRAWGSELVKVCGEVVCGLGAHSTISCDSCTKWVNAEQDLDLPAAPNSSSTQRQQRCHISTQSALQMTAGGRSLARRYHNHELVLAGMCTHRAATMPALVPRVSGVCVNGICPR